MMSTTSTTPRREAFDRRLAHEASRSVLARIFADRPPPSSPLSRLTIDALESPRRELSVDNSSAPMSWPRAYARHTITSSQTPPSRLHTHQSIFESSPAGAPRSASSDFHQQLQEHQHQRFLLTQATELHRHQHLEAQAEPQDQVTVLREQVALLLKNLEDEKKRRMLEQKLMQEVTMNIVIVGVLKRHLINHITMLFDC